MGNSKPQFDGTASRRLLNHGNSPPACELRIILAEDDYDTRLGISALLEADGHHVHTVASGAELLDDVTGWLLDEERDPPFDLIITDVRMPGINGLNIVEGLRANGWNKPIIVMSAFADDEMSERVHQMGDATFLPKPFEPSDLVSAIDNFVQ